MHRIVVSKCVLAPAVKSLGNIIFDILLRCLPPPKVYFRNLLLCDESLLSTILLSCTDPPEILYYSRNLTVNEFFETNLFCNASGNPSPRILWRLPNGSSLELANNKFLTFKNTSKRQHGRYSCKAFNRVGNSTFRAAVYLNVQCKYLNILLSLAFKSYFLVFIHK